MDIRGAEILATGTWNKRWTFSVDDLDGIVKSFDFFNLAGKVPLKLGHNEDQDLTDGQPALGWVSKIYREGNKLLADFMDVPTIVSEAIRKGLYKFISVEMAVDVTANTRVVPYLLTAVALLGADIPAVGTLKDLQALVMSAVPGLQGATRIAFRREEPNQPGGRKAMADEGNTKELEDLRKQLERANSENATLKATSSDVTARLTKVESDHKAEKVKEHRGKIVAMFKEAVEGKKILPRSREMFFKRYGVESDDDGVMKIALSDVEGFIKENPSPFAKSNSATRSGDPDEIPVGGMPDDELRARAIKFCRDRQLDPSKWENLHSAGIAIMRADPQLGERYRMLPDDHADGKYEQT